MSEGFTYDSVLQVCEGVQGKVNAHKEKKIDYLYCEGCNVGRIMYPLVTLITYCTVTLRWTH